MISSVNFSVANPPKLVITGLAKIVKQVPYQSSDVIRGLKKKPDAPFVEVLASVFKRSVDDIKSIFDIKDVQGLDSRFNLLKKWASEKGFKDVVSQFLQKENFVNGDNVVEKLPSRLAILAKGKDEINNDLTKLADKVVLQKGAKFAKVEGKELILKNIISKKMTISAKKVIGADLKFKIISADTVHGRNFKGEIIGYLDEDYNTLLKELSGETVVKKEQGYTTLFGKNKVDSIIMEGPIKAENLTAGNISSFEGGAEISGKKNKIRKIWLHKGLKGENLKVKTVTVVDGDVELSGKSRVSRSLRANRLKTKGNDVLVLNPIELYTEASPLFLLKNWVKLLKKRREIKHRHGV